MRQPPLRSPSELAVKHAHCALRTTVKWLGSAPTASKKRFPPEQRVKLTRRTTYDSKKCPGSTCTSSKNTITPSYLCHTHFPPTYFLLPTPYILSPTVYCCARQKTPVVQCGFIVLCKLYYCIGLEVLLPFVCFVITAHVYMFYFTITCLLLYKHENSYYMHAITTTKKKRLHPPVLSNKKCVIPCLPPNALPT